MRPLYETTREKPTVTVGISKDPGASQVEGVSIHLDGGNPKILKRFYCPGCGDIAFEYFGTLKVIAAGRGNVEVTLPNVVQCKTSRCKTMLYIEN